jgi:glycosyltransferase involved in cell wall biosynthesis
MNILLTSDVFPPNCGGSGWSTFFLARTLKSSGLNVKVLTFDSDGKGITHDDYRGVEVIRYGRDLKDGPAMRFVEKKRSLSAFEDAVSDIITKENIQAVHAAHYLSALASVGAARKRGIPFVVTVRDYWPVCLYSTMIQDGRHCAGCADDKMKRCFAGYNKSYAGVSSFALPALRKEMQKRRDALAAADMVVFVSRHLEKEVRKVIPEIKSVVIPNGVDIEYVNSVLKQPAQFSITPSYAVFIGKMEKYKGTAMLAKILENPKFTAPVVFIGGGSERAGLIKLTQQSGRRAVFLNWIPNDDVLRIMKNAKMLLFPSIWAEPLSRVLLEALSVGLPVVAMASGGTPEIIADGKNGLLGRSEDEFIAKAVSLASDDEKLKTFSRESRKTAAERFNSEKLAGEWLGLYEKIVAEKQTPA